MPYCAVHTKAVENTSYVATADIDVHLGVADRSSNAHSRLADVYRMLGLPVTAAIETDLQTFTHVKFKRHQPAYRLNQPFNYLYMVHSGFLKTVFLDDIGSESVLGFPMKGDLLGIDGIASGHHQSEAIALSDVVLVAIPFKSLSSLMAKHIGLDVKLMAIMSKILSENNL